MATYTADAAVDEGRIVFSQPLDLVPRHEFLPCVNRYKGNHGVRTFSCWDQNACMVFAQLTCQESLRDVEACLWAMPERLYHMGIRGTLFPNTLAVANEKRAWRIYADSGQILIDEARPLYADDPFGVKLSETVYALDSTTIDLCLSVCPWVAFRTTKWDVKMHTLLDQRGSIPVFIKTTHAAAHDVNNLDDLIPEPGAVYLMDRAYLDFARPYRLEDKRAFFVTRAKKNLKMRRLYSHSVDRANGLICDQTVRLTGFYSSKDYQDNLRRIRYSDPDSGNVLTLRKNNKTYSSHDCTALQVPVAGDIILHLDQRTPAHHLVLRHFRERRQDPDLDRGHRVCLGSHRP